jgi:hypothetical protein
MVGGSILYPPNLSPTSAGLLPLLLKNKQENIFITANAHYTGCLARNNPIECPAYWPCSADHHNGTSAFGFGPALKSNPNWLKGSPMCLTLLGWLIRILGL